MGLSFTHLILITIIIFLVFGPGRLPQLGKSFGDSVKNYRKALKGEDEIDVTPRKIEEHED